MYCQLPLRAGRATGTDVSFGNARKWVLRSRQFDGLDDRGIVVFRLVDPRRYRPHPHRLGGKRSHQVTRVGLVAQPAGIVAGARMSGMRSWISATNELAGVVMIAKVRIHSSEIGSFQFSHSPPRPKGWPSFIAIA